jgi:hypothetical protein
MFVPVVFSIVHGRKAVQSTNASTDIADHLGEVHA